METVQTIPDSISFAALITVAGVPVAAALITTVVAILNGIPPLKPVIDRFTGAAVAFVLSAVLYFLAGISVGVSTLDEALVVFAAWVSCASAAVGIHQVVVRGALTQHQT